MLRPLLLAAAAAGLLAACATPQSTPDVAAKAASTPADCLTTGTRIALKPGECVSASGRVYSRDELDQTGAFSTAEALRRLDPTFH